MPQHFDFKFYQDNKLIEEYFDKLIQNNKYLIKIDFYILKQEDSYLFYKKDCDYEIKIDFNEKKCFIKLIKENIMTEVDVVSSEIEESDEHINITYILETEENIKKIIIDKKE